MKKISGIYIIKNNINDKVYIGSAVNCHRRFIQHKSDFNKKQFNRALQENLMTKTTFSFSSDTINNFTKVLDFLNTKQKLLNKSKLK